MKTKGKFALLLVAILFALNAKATATGEQTSSIFFPPLAVGQSHVIVIANDGTVKAWGENSSGQLGLGDTQSRNVPTTIPGLTAVKQLTAGESFSAALMNDGTVKTWGSNSNGQLGYSSSNKTTPATVPGLSNVIQIAAGGSHILALLNDGTVKAWVFVII